jgi:pimeloyl-ACP methyl ester carboxylesterase
MTTMRAKVSWACRQAVLGVALALTASACQTMPARVTDQAGAPNGADECVGPLQTQPAPPPAGFTPRRLDVRGVNMHYLIGGNGPEVVVLLHGWPQNWYSWRFVMPSLARHFTVLAIDLPGLGDSRGSAPSYDTKTVASVVHGLVADALGYRHVHIVGHDWGAAVAFAYAAFHRESTSSLAMMGFPILPGPATDQQAVRGQFWWFGFQAVPQLPEQLVAGRQRTYLGWFFENSLWSGNRLDPDAVTEYVRTNCRPNVLHDGFELYRATPTDTSDNASLAANKLTLPVLYLEQTAVSTRLATPRDPEAFKALLRARIQPMVSGPIAVQLVPNSGHWIPEENPDFVSSQLTAFINTASPSKR